MMKKLEEVKPNVLAQNTLWLEKEDQASERKYKPNDVVKKFLEQQQLNDKIHDENMEDSKPIPSMDLEQVKSFNMNDFLNKYSYFTSDGSGSKIWVFGLGLEISPKNPKFFNFFPFGS